MDTDFWEDVVLPGIFTIIIICLIAFIFVLPIKNLEEQEKEYLETTQLIPIKYDGDFKICYDRYTKVMYSVSTGVHSKGVVTLLVDADGKPLIYEGNNQ